MTERKLEQFQILNLGSGKNFIESAWNCDINPDFKPDLVADMSALDFPAESFREVLAKDCIDHISHAQTKALLRKIFVWLKPNGTLTVHTPNLTRLTELIHKFPESNDGKEALRWLYGSTGEGTTAYWSNIIRWCYSPESLREILTGIGFMVLPVTFDCNGFAFTLVAVKR